MRPNTIAILVFLVLAAILWKVSSHRKAVQRSGREARYQAALTTYTHDFTPGLTRAQVEDLLHSRSISAEQVQYNSPSWDDVIKIGQEHSPRFFCAHEDIAIRLHFTPSGPSAAAPASPADTLTEVSLLRWVRNCL